MKTSLEVPIAVDRITAEMLGSPRNWLLPLIIEGRAHSRLLRAELGADLAPRHGRLRLDLGQPSSFGVKVAMPFRVWFEDAERWASYDNVLTASWFGAGRTQLAIESQYEQPTWLTYREQTLLHQVVEAISRHFLGSVAAALTERVHASRPAQRRDARLAGAPGPIPRRNARFGGSGSRRPPASSAG